MRVVVALGGSALRRRAGPLTADVLREVVRTAARALAPVAERHELVISHGSGPQVGPSALRANAYSNVEPYPIDALGGETEVMIGYMLEQELGNLVPPDVPLATLLPMIEVDPDDPAFDDPTAFVGPDFDQPVAEQLAAEKGWAFRKDGAKWRRVVPYPLPKRVCEIRPIKWLLERDTIVICAVGGGIHTACTSNGSRTMRGVEAIIDKDLASELLARELDADVFVMGTDVDGVYLEFGTPQQRLLGRVTTSELRRHRFAAGSIGSKVEAAIRFAELTGRRAAIGTLRDIEAIVEGDRGTNIVSG